MDMKEDKNIQKNQAETGLDLPMSFYHDKVCMS